VTLDLRATSRRKAATINAVVVIELTLTHVAGHITDPIANVSWIATSCYTIARAGRGRVDAGACVSRAQIIARREDRCSSGDHRGCLVAVSLVKDTLFIEAVCITV
jgi:hypothetical protein